MVLDNIIPYHDIVKVDGVASQGTWAERGDTMGKRRREKLVELLIKDGQRLIRATHGITKDFELPTYDDGFGPLWIHRHSIGISGIVRAQTWEEAYGICEDEFFPEADETIAELQKEFGFTREYVNIVNDGTAEREATLADYGDKGLKDGISFVRWDLRETPNSEAWVDNELFQEAYGFRPNGPNVRDKIGHGIYAKDLNGDCLDRLTPELVEELRIKLEIKDEEGSL